MSKPNCHRSEVMLRIMLGGLAVATLLAVATGSVRSPPGVSPHVSRPAVSGVELARGTERGERPSLRSGDGPESLTPNGSSAPAYDLFDFYFPTRGGGRLEGVLWDDPILLATIGRLA